MLVYNIVHNSLYFHIKKHYQPPLKTPQMDISGYVSV